MGHKQTLGARADQFWAHNSKLAHDVVVAVAPALPDPEEDGYMAAVRPGGGRRGSQRCGGGQSQQWGSQKKVGGGGKQATQATHALTHCEQARLGSGLCRSHFVYDAAARHYEAPCSWSGN